MIRPALRTEALTSDAAPPGPREPAVRAAPGLAPQAHRHLVLGRREGRAMAAARRAIESHPALEGRALQWHVPSEPGLTPETAAHAAQAAAADAGLVVAVGGDGTVNAVAQACVAHGVPMGVPMGVLTLGSFNFFTRQQRLPAELQAAVQALADARQHAVRRQQRTAAGARGRGGGRLAGHAAVDSFSCTAVTVEGAGGRALRALRVAFDGERTRMPLPLHFEVGAAPLWLVAPAPAAAPPARRLRPSPSAPR